MKIYKIWNRTGKQNIIQTLTFFIETVRVCFLFIKNSMIKFSKNTENIRLLLYNKPNILVWEEMEYDFEYYSVNYINIMDSYIYKE